MSGFVYQSLTVDSLSLLFHIFAIQWTAEKMSKYHIATRLDSMSNIHMAISRNGKPLSGTSFQRLVEPSVCSRRHVTQFSPLTVISKHPSGHRPRGSFTFQPSDRASVILIVVTIAFRPPQHYEHPVLVFANLRI